MDGTENTVAHLEELGACPLCGSSEVSDTYSRRVGLTVRECASCGLAYLDPRPTWSSMLQRYERDYAFLPLAGQWKDARSFDTLGTDARRIAEIRSLEGASVMDVGCGPGTMLASLRLRGATGICGVEPSRVAADFAWAHIAGSRIHVSDWEHAPLGDEKFDVICGLDLIEHLYEPRAFVRWVHARLAPGGVLYLKTPNWGAVEKYGAAWGGLSIDFEHVCYFAAETLSRLLVEEGFEIRSLGYEPARAGLAGENPLGREGHGRMLSSARRVVRALPGVNKVAYRGLEAVRRRRRRGDLEAGVADVLVVVATV